MGAIATNGIFFFKGVLFFFDNNDVYETIPLGRLGTEIVAVRVPYYGQSESTSRCTVLVAFFRVCLR